MAVHSEDTGEKTAQVLLKSPNTELFELEEVYSGDGLEMAKHTGKETAKTSFTFPMIDILESVQWYLGDDLEIAGHSVVTLGL